MAAYCGKVPYETYLAARKALVGFKERTRNHTTGKRVKKNYKPTRVYKCDTCGKYHLTSARQ